MLLNNANATPMRPAVRFDAAGAGGTGTNSASWSHTIGTNANALIVGVGSFGFSISTPTVGSTAMTLVASIANSWSGTYPMAMYVLLNPPTGVQTISVSANSFGIVASSVSYSGVVAFGAPVLVSGSSTAASITVQSATNLMAATVMYNNNNAFTGFSGSSRYSSTSGLLIGDTSGAANVTFTATSPVAQYGALAIPLM